MSSNDVDRKSSSRPLERTLMAFFSAERQSSLEQASFNLSQIGGRVFAKTPLLSARFLPLV